MRGGRGPIAQWEGSQRPSMRHPPASSHPEHLDSSPTDAKSHVTRGPMKKTGDGATPSTQTTTPLVPSPPVTETSTWRSPAHNRGRCTPWSGACATTGSEGPCVLQGQGAWGRLREAPDSCRRPPGEGLSPATLEALGGVCQKVPKLRRCFGACDGAWQTSAMEVTRNLPSPRTGSGWELLSTRVSGDGLCSPAQLWQTQPCCPVLPGFPFFQHLLPREPVPGTVGPQIRAECEVLMWGACRCWGDHEDPQTRSLQALQEAQHPGDPCHPREDAGDGLRPAMGTSSSCWSPRTSAPQTSRLLPPRNAATS